MAPERSDGGTDPTGSEDPDGLGRRGRILVATLLIALLGVPVLIYWRPPGVPFLVAFLVLPLVPAILLGLVAVWSLTESDPRGGPER